MKELERERKNRFIGILLTIGVLLGSMLTIVNLGEAWELSLFSLCVFILFSMFYWYSINYRSLKKSQEIKNFKIISFFVALSLSVLFMIIISKPIIHVYTVTSQGLNFHIRIVLFLMTFLMTFGYYGIMVYILYRNLTKI